MDRPPRNRLPVLVLLVPAAEVVLAGLWVLGIRRTRTAVAGLAFCIALLVTSVAQWALDPVPTCGCFGALAKYVELESTLPKLIGINGAMIAAIALLLLTSARRDTATRRAESLEDPRPQPAG